MKKLRFCGNEIVRLLQDHPDDGLKAGDCGVIWGVYDFEKPFYEASFYNRNGDFTDMMFAEKEVEEVLGIDGETFEEKLEQVRHCSK